MGDQHLVKLEGALSQKGWVILERDSKIDWYSAGAWTVQRSRRVGPFHLTFVAVDGIGSSTVRDLPSAWSCELSEDKRVGLYFSRLRTFDSELDRFLIELDRFETEEVEKTKHA
jgi:hypothetical protein